MSATAPCRSADLGSPACRRGASRSILPRLVLPPLWREAVAPRALLSLLGAGAGAGPASRSQATDPPALLIPGLLGSDASLATLASFLHDHGWAPWPSGICRNVDCSGKTVRHLVNRLEHITHIHDARAALVGHSRGGILARAVAQRRPDLVSGVVTVGSPHRDQLAVHPLLWANLAGLATLGSLGLSKVVRLGCRGTSACCRGFDNDAAAPLPAGVGGLSVYSRRDGVVDWRACLDPDQDNVEVKAGHCAMPTDPATLRVVTEALTRFAAARDEACCTAAA